MFSPGLDPGLGYSRLSIEDAIGRVQQTISQTSTATGYDGCFEIRFVLLLGTV